MAKRRKRRSNNNYAIWIVIIFLAALTYLLIRWNEEKKARFIRYEAFGILLPAEYMIHGIDVSRYQQYISWEQVKAMNVQNIRMGFAFIKATEGDNYTDPYFKRNWFESRKNRITRGAYHFFQPEKNAVRQARLFISTVKIIPGDLPPVLDVEVCGTSDVATLQTKVKTWLQVVENYYGIKPVIYTNTDFYKKYLENEFDDYPLWVAHYYEPHKPRIRREWLFWQHNDGGNVNGIASKVDFNVFNGDSVAFRSLLKK